MLALSFSFSCVNAALFVRFDSDGTFVIHFASLNYSSQKLMFNFVASRSYKIKQQNTHVYFQIFVQYYYMSEPSLYALATFTTVHSYKGQSQDCLL